ncbi:crotonobetainyl-CoA:carnitine CoA-transferase CaiB-like acyl-CoA transferase [Oikeobacillus pervagus]|uniref:Crotonobetainyl-CoA:carnitine CoA-transferase CaiB-like acyl-CoA transferase n=1 Tax=Oikeobacillus pervagus TaxID=1325931 RepID=A0AAJ1T6F6_9BACI|nr:CoA transferase [Oikeobacillus pervagus]MDQ0215480.1 crotonobetainyl-CoA:carnitine CoA-transferase CaiB-like acyl-CoA transferase [Oikeobacillus pervagus]
MMLANIVILDFTQYLPGPYASLRLADLGADVIKIEGPNGDPARYLSGGKVYEANNRNKKSLSFNLKDKQQVEQVCELIKKADVIMESFRPGVMAKLGLGYDQVRTLKEDIIYCSLTGFGQQGPLSTLGSHDLNYMALGGALSQLKDENGKPVHPSITFADLIGGMMASEAILSALVQRERTGEGKYIDLALADSIVSLMTTHVLYKEGRGIPSLDGSLICYHLYETKDGRFISLAALELKFWQQFCQAVGHEEWIPHHVSKADPLNPIYKNVKELFLSKRLTEWSEFSKKVDCCMAPVLEMNEVIDHPYIKERNLIRSSPWDELQVMTTNRSAELRKPPALNEHSVQNLSTNQ